MDRASVRGSPELSVDGHVDLLVSVDEALDQLATLDERASRLVESRFFGGSARR